VANTLRLYRVGDVGFIDWLGLDDVLSKNNICNNLSDEKTEKHRHEKHKHPETCLGSAAKAQRRAKHHRACAPAREKETLERIVPPIGPEPPPRRAAQRGLLLVADRIPNGGNWKENHGEQHRCEEHSIRVCLAESLWLHFGIADQDRQADRDNIESGPEPFHGPNEN
jgi:hypothetical protein